MPANLLAGSSALSVFAPLVQSVASLEAEAQRACPWLQSPHNHLHVHQPGCPSVPAVTEKQIVSQA